MGQVGTIRMVVSGCVSLGIFCLVTLDPSTAVAGKPQKPPADDTPPSPGVRFDDIAVDNVQSDLHDGDRTYYDDREAKVSVSFSQDGHLVLDTNTSNKTNVGRNLYIKFELGLDESITVIDSEGNERSFRSTEDLDDAGVPHDAAMQVGAFQDNFNMLTMAVGETRNDVNLVIFLFIHFPDIRQETCLKIGLAPEPVNNERHCPGSDPVRVTYLGDPDGDGLVEWRIEPCVDDDFDGLINEDPIDDRDNDGDGLVDEDGLRGLASVSQNPFASDPVTVGYLPFTFGITVLAPAP